DRALVEIGRELPDGAIVTDRDVVAQYAGDESEVAPRMPGAAVRVSSAAEVAAVMRVASERGLPVTARGGGTGRVGGAGPGGGGWGGGAAGGARGRLAGHGAGRGGRSGGGGLAGRGRARPRVRWEGGHRGDRARGDDRGGPAGRDDRRDPRGRRGGGALLPTR